MIAFLIREHLKQRSEGKERTKYLSGRKPFQSKGKCPEAGACLVSSRNQAGEKETTRSTSEWSE